MYLDKTDCTSCTSHRQLRTVICWWMCKMFFNMGFYRVTIKGIRASEQEAPILALAPHSSFTDAFPVVLLTAPSLVVKSSVKNIPFFHSKYDRVLSTSQIFFLLSLFLCHKPIWISFLPKYIFFYYPFLFLFSLFICRLFYLGYCLVPLFYSDPWIFFI